VRAFIPPSTVCNASWSLSARYKVSLRNTL
jgi:hypothetical protein